MTELVYLAGNVEIDPERINDLLTNALEGGSTYWLRRIEVKDENYHGATYGSDVPMAGGTVNVFTDEPDDQDMVLHSLTRERCLEALQLMAEHQPQHFADWREDSDDAETADVFLQFAVLGEVAFG